MYLQSCHDNEGAALCFLLEWSWDDVLDLSMLSEQVPQLLCRVGGDGIIP